MTAAALRKKLRRAGCVELRQTGSHLVIRCGPCQTVVPVHRGDLATGTLAHIRRQLAPCLPEGTL